MLITLLDQAVRAANVEAGYKTLHHYVLFLHFAFDALYKTKRDGVINNAKFIQLNMIGNRVKLPDNIFAINKCGIQVGRRIMPCVPDGELSLDPANVGFDLSCPTTDLFSFLQFSPYYYGGSVISESSTYYAARYKIAGKQIIFDRGVDGAKVYLEVVESGQTPGANTVITQDAFLPIKSYIHHRQARFKFGANSGESTAALAEFDDEMDDAVASQSNLTGAGIMNALRLRGGPINDHGIGYLPYA